MLSFLTLYDKNCQRLHVCVCVCVCVCAGNSKTLDQGPKELGLDVREELKKFHSTHYSANLMRLAVIGRGESAVVMCVRVM